MKQCARKHEHCSQWLLPIIVCRCYPTAAYSSCDAPPTLPMLRATAMWASIQRCIHAWSVTFQLSAAFRHIAQQALFCHTRKQSSGRLRYWGGTAGTTADTKPRSVAPRCTV